MRLTAIPLFILCYLGSFLFASAQNATDASIQEVKAIYKKIMSFNAMQPKEGKTYYMNYSVKTVPKDSIRDGIATSEIEIWASEKNLEIKSEQMNVYQDNKDAFIVLPQKKMVLRNDPYKPGKLDDKKMNRFRFIQDTLFALSKVNTSKEIKAGEKLVVLEVNEKGQQLLSVKRLSFLIDIKRNEFTSVKIEYTESGGGLANNIAYIEYTFKKIISDYKSKVVTDDVSKLFMKNTSELNEKYKGYALVDNRYKKNKTDLKQLK